MSRSNILVTFNQKIEWPLLYRKLTWSLLGLKSERYLHLASTCRNGKAAPSAWTRLLKQSGWRIRPGGIYPFLLPMCNLAGLSCLETNSSSLDESREPGGELQLSQQCSVACGTPRWGAFPAVESCELHTNNSMEMAGQIFSKTRNFVETTALSHLWTKTKVNWKDLSGKWFAEQYRSLSSHFLIYLLCYHLLFKVWWNHSFQTDFFSPSKFLMSINTSKVERIHMPASSLKLTFTAL